MTVTRTGGALLLTLLLLAGIPILAQNTVTDDDVDEIASQMYCPICENEPLDDCRAQTCLDWKAEIRDRLEDGWDQEQIISYFVERYGQHVVGVPQDAGLRALSFVIPALATVICVVVGVWTFLRWKQRKPKPAPSAEDSPPPSDEGDPYRSRLERDLQ